MYFLRQHGPLVQDLVIPQGAVPAILCSRDVRQHHRSGKLCADQLLGVCGPRSTTFAGRQTLSLQTVHNRGCRAISQVTRRAVRRIVTRAASVDVPAFDEKGLWPWRRAQLRRIAAFTGPALSIPLADPIMSLVDTVCIGQVCE